MKTNFFLLLIPVFLTGNLLFAQSKPVKFSLTVEYSGNTMSFKSHKGFTWKTLEFSGMEQNPVYISRTGGSGNSSVSEKSKILFSIQKTEKGFKLKGIRGTAWKTLEFSCINENCRQKINQEGMVQEKD
ncbi:MAG: hypothetical protein ACM3PT_12525 [Deltaproteobacteria bacterium]